MSGTLQLTAGGANVDSQLFSNIPQNAQSAPEELWDQKQVVNAHRISTGLNASAVMEAIKEGATFVVADIGMQPVGSIPRKGSNFGRRK